MLKDLMFFRSCPLPLLSLMHSFVESVSSALLSWNNGEYLLPLQAEEMVSGFMP